MSARKRLTARLAAFVFAAVLGFALTAAPVRAQEVTPVPLNAEDQALLLEIETYFNAIDSLRADFLQIAPEGQLAEGTFYLRRPGRLRVEYAPPVPVLIVGDGFFLHYHDKELDQINDWPIFDTPLGALTQDEVRFNDSLIVTAFEKRPGRIEVTVVQEDDPGVGSLTLVFDAAPLALRQWRVVDAQGFVTTVSLLGLETNIELSAKLFVFDDPRTAPIRR